ncbi:MAG: hypothetical protein NVS3B1_05960 [Marmoricola sp.]
MTSFDVLRDSDDRPVTITPLQCQAIRHAFAVYESVISAEEARGAGPHPAFPPRTYRALLLVSKSALMGRMLYEGRPPLPVAPPVNQGAPAYHLADPDLCPTCGELRTGRPGLLRWEPHTPHNDHGRKSWCSQGWHR